MTTVGIIGGLGPETTSKFYLEVVFGCQKKNAVSRPPVLIWNVPLNYEIERDLLIKSTGEERYLPYIIEAAQRLEKGGADFLVMPCNSLHIFIDEIRKSVQVPVLNIVEETARFLKNNGIKKVGILATSSLLNHKLYENYLEREKIEQITPSPSDQNKVGDLINNLVLNRYKEKDKNELLDIIRKFKTSGLKYVILACTDLQLLIPHYPGIEIYDTMKIFADETVNEILK